MNIADTKLLACHPASTKHFQLNDEELTSTGVSTNLVRISVGIENTEHIIQAMNQVLDNI